MDGRAQEHTGHLWRQRQPVGNHRIDDHRQCRQRRHTDHGEQRGLLFLRMVRQRRRQCQRCRSPADRRRATGQHAEQSLKAQRLGRDHRHTDGHHHQDHHQRHRFPTQRHHLFQGDTHAQQCHADAQHTARGKLDAGLARALPGQEIQGHAQQQRKQHDRRTVVLGQKRSRRRNDQADDEPRGQFARATVDPGQGDGAHGAASSQRMMNAWSSMISTG
ncbi:hypothetical protein D3C73_954700 [compost metagenome]